MLFPEDLRFGGSGQAYLLRDEFTRNAGPIERVIDENPLRIPASTPAAKSPSFRQVIIWDLLLIIKLWSVRGACMALFFGHFTGSVTRKSPDVCYKCYDRERRWKIGDAV